MKKLHPASIAVRSLSRSLNTGFLFFVIGVIASPGGTSTNLFIIGGMVLVGIAVGVVYELAYYKRFQYGITDDSFDVISGVVSSRNREVPLRRIQNVDVRQTVIHRAFGIAAVHIETAGGGQTEVTLRYVDENEAKRLTRVLRQGSSERSVTDEDGVTATGETDDDETLLFELQRNELVILSIFTIDPGASILGGIALSFASGFDPTTLVPTELVGQELPGTGLAAIAWAIVLFLLAAWVLSALLTFTRYYGFRLTQIGDELHYERGLLQRYSGSIPLDKVQTLTITESVPFRWFGYGSLAVETAGYAPGQSDSRGAESAIPLAKRERVFSLAQSIEPFETPTLEQPPLRAFERYAVRYIVVISVLLALGYALATMTNIVRDWHVIAALLIAVPPAAYLKWKNRGYDAADDYFFARTGFWRRSTKVVPYYRVQAVLYYQTIFQRRRRLASVTADTASSASFFGRAATAHDIDASQALETQRRIEDRLQHQLTARGRERTVGTWFERRDAEKDNRSPDSRHLESEHEGEYRDSRKSSDSH